MKMKVFNTARNYQTPSEVIRLIIPSLFLITMASLNTTLINKHFSLYTTKDIIIFSSDFVLIVFPLIAYYMPTLYLDKFQSHVIVFDIITGYSISLFYKIIKKNKADSKSENPITTSDQKLKPFVTNMRSTVSLLTAISILAVDFRPFPEKYMKTENYGYSLMDVGVGLFIFANGIVAPEITDETKESLRKTITGTASLLFLGLLRFVLTKIFNYPFSEIEYGLHWNFFMTLAFTKICSSFIINYFPFKNKLVISISLLIFYETVLNNGLGLWILSNSPRTDFISANREGIFSIIGYVALYFLSVQIGRLLKQTKPRDLIISLLRVTITLYALTYILDHYFGVSRRMANAGYCTWILFLGTLMGLLFYIAELFLYKCYKIYNFKKNTYTPLIIEAINYNGLPFFMIANLLTGIVNLSIDTLNTPDDFSMLIVTVYMFINCYFVTFLYKHKIKLKLFS